MNSVPLPMRIALGLMLFTVFACNDNQELLTKATTYQKTIDSKIELVANRQNEIKQSILDNAAINQDTFTLAKSLIPLNAAKFKLEFKYDEFTKAIESFQNGKVDNDSLERLINQSTTYVNEIMQENDFE